MLAAGWLLALALPSVGSAETSSVALISRDSLQSIVDRNPFGLKPPPPPPTNEVAAPPEVKLNINITGITRTRKGKRVHLVVQPEGKDAKSKYLSIDEGDRQDGVKILEVSEKSDKVKIQSGGVESVLSFATHGLKSTAPPPNANQNKSGILPPGMLPQPGQINSPAPASGPQIISRGGLTRIGEGGSGAASASGFGSGNPSSSTRIPSRSMRTAVAVEDGGAGNEKAALQVIQMEAQKISNPHIEFPPVPGGLSTPNAPGIPSLPQ